MGCFHVRIVGIVHLFGKAKLASLLGKQLPAKHETKNANCRHQPQRSVNLPDCCHRKSLFCGFILFSSTQKNHFRFRLSFRVSACWVFGQQNRGRPVCNVLLKVKLRINTTLTIKYYEILTI